MNIKLNPHVALLCCNGIWGLSYPIYTYALPKHIGVEAMVTITLVATGVLSLCSLLFKRWREEGPKVERKDMPMLILAGLIVVLIRKYFLMAGLSMTSPIDGSVIAALGPIAVLLLSVAVGQDRFSTLKIIGVTLGLVGVLVMLLSNSGHQSASNLLLGNILIMLCVMCTAIYVVWFKDIVAKYSPMTILRWIMTSAAVIILPIGARSVTQVDYSGFDMNMWLLLAYMTLMPTLLPNYLLMYGLKKVKPALSSV
ncbi:MAG: DMT family transporter, partial [Rikenellaceae bacterium]